MKKTRTKRIGFWGLALCAALALCVLTGTLVPTSAFAAATEDDTLMQTYKSGTGPVNGPTVVLDAENKDALDSIAANTQKPSNAIVRFNASAEVVDKAGTSLGSFATVYTDVLKANNVIPVVSVADEAAADALIDFLRNEMNLLDLAVLSQNPALVKKVRMVCKRVRGIVEYPTQTDLYQIVKVTNENYVNVVIVPQELATTQNVRYIQGRFKTVWVKADSGKPFDVYDCVNSGAYGIVTAEVAAAYEVLEQYDEKDLTRTPFNVGHRGLPGLCNENSASGVAAAVKLGATHVELDAQLTTDQHIVIMHNGTIDATTTGTGAVEKFSLEEIRQYQLNQIQPEEIPTLEDILDVLKGTDVILVLEIKSSKSALLTVLEEVVDEYDFWDQLVVISFYTSILEEMKYKLPQVPTANLNHVEESNFLARLKEMGDWNTGVDTDYADNGRDFNEQLLRDRGFIGWYWTYNDERGMQKATKEGFVGLTTNDAAYFADKVMLIDGMPAYNVHSVKVGDTVALTATDYRGEKTQVNGTVFAVEEHDEYFRVVAHYSDRLLGGLCTQSYNLYKGADPNAQGGKTEKGCKGTMSACVGGAAGLLLICGACILLSGKKRNGIAR